MRKITEIIIHCSATPQGVDYTVADIDRWHRQRGFNKRGYHYVIYRDGSIHPGRPVEEIGAHYKFTKHWGVGAEIRLLNCFYKKPDGWEEVVGKDTSFGTKRAALTLGAQYYF